MFELLKEIWGDLIGIVGMLWVLTHLVLIGLYGAVTILEESPVILTAEIGLVVFVLVLLVERTVKDFRHRR